MPFKRYIYKHGKRLGPYYYENVRSHDGSIRTVYVGTNPHHHPKHRVKKPLFFLILVLMLILILGGSLFLLQNKAYLIKKVRAEEPDFDVDQILIKILVRSSEFLEKQVRVMNTGDAQAIIKVEALGLGDIVKIDDDSFTIKPGQTKIVALNFSSFFAEQKIEHQPGVYVGKLIVSSEKATKQIPIVVEIETKNVLFDMNLNPVAIERKVRQGSDTTIEVRLFNLESIESVNVDVEYFVKDMNGNTIQTESETVVVKSQASFFKKISVPKNLKPGPYVFAAQVRFGSSIGTASYLFDVVGPEPPASFVEYCKNNVLCLGLSLTTMLLLFAFIAYFYFFIGAYLYEKVTGLVTLPRRKKKEEIEEPSIFDKFKSRFDEWKKSKELRRAEKEKLGKEEELKQLAEERKVQPSKELNKFYKILDRSEEAAEDKDIYEVEKLYIKARDLYAKLSDKEKREVYEKLVDLYNKRNQLAKKSKRKKYVEERKIELGEEIGKIEEQRKGLEKRKAVKEFFHKIGLYKIPEEKKQIAIQKDKERQEKLKREQESQQQKELEAKRKEEEKQRKKLEEERREQDEVRKKEEHQRKNAERKKLRKERNRKIIEFFHKIGLYKTLEEKRQIALQKEKEKQERLRGNEELKRQKELEEQRAEEEKHVREEEKKWQRELEVKKQEELKRQKELGKQKQEQIKAQKLKSSARWREQFKAELSKLKIGWFKKFFKPEFKLKEQEEKPKEEIKAKAKGEAEELEEAIRSLDLFKKVEKGKKEVKVALDAKKKPIISRSKKLDGFYKVLSDTKSAIENKKISKAKKLYVESRNLYISLSNEEKKEVYDELMDVYTKLL